MKIAIIGCNMFHDEMTASGVVPINPLHSKSYNRYLLFRKKIGIKVNPISFINTRNLRLCTNCDCVILFDSVTLENARIITETVEKIVNRKCKLIFYYWNTFDEKKNYSNIISPRWESWTFDYSDALKYKFNFANTFYFSSLVEKKTKIKYDAFFIGFEKGRAKILHNIQNSFRKCNLNPFIRIVNGNFLIRNIKKIDYNRVRHIIAKSRVIIDINKQGQYGLTLRSLEAIFNNKKLIVNNCHIREYLFYDSSNILITEDGILDSIELEHFLTKKTKPIPNDLIEYYSFKSWLERIVYGIKAKR